MVSDIERAEDAQEEKYYDELSEFVMARYHEASQHKTGSGVADAIHESLRRFKGVYGCEEQERFGDILTYLNVTGELCNIASNWLKNSYFSAQDRPWTLEPTPNPELPEKLQQELSEAVRTQLVLMAQTTDLNQKGARSSLIQSLSNTASRLAMQHATERTKGMSRLIEDQMEQANWNKVLFEFIADLVVYPAAVLKGPVLTRKLAASPTEGSMSFKERNVLEVRRVDPADLFPSPDSSTPQDGTYIIERISMSRSELLRAKKLKGFDKEAIDLVIQGAQLTGSKELEPENGGDDIAQARLTGVSRDTPYVLDVYEYRGSIPGVDIIRWTDSDDNLDEKMENFDYKVDVGGWGSISPHMDYEAVVWVCNDITVMAKIAKSDPIPYRPYFVTSMYKIPGAFWGSSIPMKVASLQDEINNAARSRTLNSAMSSGPITQIDKSRFPDNDLPDQLMPWDFFVTQTNTIQGNNGAPAIRFDNIPNTAQQLTAVINDNWERAYRVTGITPQMAGLNQSSPRTLGAYSLQYSSATKGIQSVVANIDHDIIEELIKQFYYWNMIYHEDETIKGDIEVRVRGASGLIAQEQKQARPLELLQALGPILAQMQPQTALALANKVLVESGFDPAELGAPPEQGLAQQEAQSKYGLQEGQPQTDGRSGNVPAQIQEEQLPPGPQ